MISPTGIIPEELMYPQKKQDVIRFLLAQALPGNIKRRILEGWCVTIGVRCRPRDYYLLESSGIDGTEVPALPQE
jgi:hypothetical protein